MFQGSFGQKFGCATWLLYFFLFSVNWPIYRFFRLTTLGVLKCKMPSLFLSEARSFSTQLNRQKNKKKKMPLDWAGLCIFMAHGNINIIKMSYTHGLKLTMSPVNLLFKGSPIDDLVPKLKLTI